MIVNSGVQRGGEARMYISAADVINSTDAEKLASSSDHPTPQSMETEDKQKASGRQESR